MQRLHDMPPEVLQAASKWLRIYPTSREAAAKGEELARTDAEICCGGRTEADCCPANTYCACPCHCQCKARPIL
jgi:hypothetical protein